MSRNLRTFGFLLLTVAHAPAAAQLCEEDAGAEVSDDDAGHSDEDAGVVCEPADSGMPPIDEPDASLPDGGTSVDAGPDESATCSCETVQGTGAGRIHVCTGAREQDVCDRFECESSVVRDRACPTRGVELCCEMPARGLYSQLYDDCVHPNCETGFRAQCQDFGGSVREGACEVEAPGVPDDRDSRGGCSASAASPLRGTSFGSLWLLAAGLALALRARRRSR